MQHFGHKTQPNKFWRDFTDEIFFAIWLLDFFFPLRRDSISDITKRSPSARLVTWILSRQNVTLVQNLAQRSLHPRHCRGKAGTLRVLHVSRSFTVYIYACICVYTYLYICIYIYIYMHVCLHECMYVSIYERIHVLLYVRAYTYKHTDLMAYGHIDIWYMYTCIIYIYLYVHTEVFTYMYI